MTAVATMNPADLVRDHAPWMFNWFRVRLPAGSRVSAEDLVQEAFLILHRNRDQVREPAKYLSGIARKLLADRLRQEKRRREVELESAGSGPHPDLDPLREAVAELPEELQQIVLTYYSGDVTYEETARILGIPRGTVQSRLRRAIELLQERMKGD